VRHTAAVMFDCAKNEEPVMITNMIMASELYFTAVSELNPRFELLNVNVITPGGQSCMTTSDYKCVVDVTTAFSLYFN
jgi:hypothetical protein